MKIIYEKEIRKKMTSVVFMIIDYHVAVTSVVDYHVVRFV